MSDPPQDLLTMLLEARDEDGSTMSDSEVRDEVITYSMTGFETVGESLTWTLFLLARHPEVDARVTAEARTAFDPEAVTPRGPDLPYSKAVVQESLAPLSADLGLWPLGTQDGHLAEAASQSEPGRSSTYVPSPYTETGASGMRRSASTQSAS